MSPPSSDPTPDPGHPAASEPTPDPRTVYEWLGGEAVLRSLVDRFYDLMDLEPALQELRKVHPTTLDSARDKLFWFLSGWMGGPDLYIPKFGHPMLRARHMPYSIGIAERDQWLACMSQALDDLQVDPVLAQRLMASFTQTADWMRNRHG